MINYDSILSAFDGKPTLLQWLKLVKKALDESVLKDITLKQDGAQVVFTFNFEDGTSISTPAVTLPKGDTGATGAKGEQGVSVTGVDEVSDEVVGSQTLTTLRFHFSDGTNDEVVVYAENGKTDGVGVVIDQPASATSGTLTADQLGTLQASDNNYIIFNNELYRLADKQHTTGMLSYTHTGWDGTAIQDKSINITISTRAWTLVQGESGGGKLYQHKIKLNHSVYGESTIVFNSSHTLFSTFDELRSYLDKAPQKGWLITTENGFSYSASISASTSEINAWYSSTYGGAEGNTKSATELISDTVTEL